MSSWLLVMAAWFGGWGIARWHRLLRGAPGILPGAMMWGIALSIVWMAAANVAGVRWTPTSLVAPLAVAGLAGFFAPRRDRDGRSVPWRWAGVAAAAAGARALLVAGSPAFGWDFRYQWGLKAKVYAVAGHHDFAWLAWPYNLVANPDYPPLWSDLVAGGIVLGGDAAGVASAWHAAFVLGIAAACWEAAALAPLPARALAAAAGAWAPVLFAPSVAHSGYAEPLLMFAACVALGALPRLARGEPGAGLTVAAARALMALTKNEGNVLAVAVILGVWRTAPRRVAVATAGTILAVVAAWRGVVAWFGIPGFGSVVSPSWVVDRLGQLPARTVGILTPAVAGVIVVWLLVVPGLRGVDLRGVRTALGFWAIVLPVAYVVSPFPLDYLLRYSLDRVLAVPLPIALAFSIGALGRADRGGEERTPEGAPAG